MADGNRIDLAAAASYVGAVIENGENGSVVLKTGDAITSFDSSALVKKNGKIFVDIDAYAKAFSLYVTERESVKIISTIKTSDWALGQEDIIRYALDVFAKQL